MLNSNSIERQEFAKILTQIAGRWLLGDHVGHFDVDRFENVGQ